MNILKQLSSPNKCINFINNFLKKKWPETMQEKQKDNHYVIPRDRDVHEN